MKNKILEEHLNDVENFKQEQEKLVKELTMRDLDIQQLVTKNNSLETYNHELANVVKTLEQERDILNTTVTAQLQDLDKLQTLINKADQEILRLESEINQEKEDSQQCRMNL